MMLHTKRFLPGIDWISLLILAIICIISCSFIYSATYTEQIPYSLFFKKQCMGSLCGLLIYLFYGVVNFRTIIRIGYYGYILVIALLLFTLIKGTIGMGAQRWLYILFFRIQPSELAKLFFPCFVGYFLQSNTHMKHLLPVLVGMLLIGTFLILKQPDLGTAVIIMLSALILFWFMGVKKRYFVYFFCAMLIGMPIIWHCLKPYQKKRISVFLGQGSSQKERYQTEQALIAIGSGGLFGKGYFKGTQNRLQFLPERRTDFIFAVLCEEWGLCGALFLLLLYCILCMRSLSFILSIQDHIIQLTCFGLLLHIVLSMIINIGMVLGLLPIVGIPLPFMSYGLSNLWICFASLGAIDSITRQQDIISYLRMSTTAKIV